MLFLCIATSHECCDHLCSPSTPEVIDLDEATGHFEDTLRQRHEPGDKQKTTALLDEWLVISMKLGGMDNLFFVSGSEIAFWQESVAKARRGTSLFLPSMRPPN